MRTTLARCALAATGLSPDDVGLTVLILGAVLVYLLIRVVRGSIVVLRGSTVVLVFVALLAAVLVLALRMA
ncbi:hypothetical protein J5X84_35175 [Streptosporangiaceae bacterium NEAU-GS5]|nr:hypothetical protein [Streptosporangiaceae bacterium NEAU-GS5]